MKQIFTPTITFNQNSNIHTTYTPVLSVPGILTDISVSRLSCEIGQIAWNGNIVGAGTQTLAVIPPTDRFIVKEISISANPAILFALLDGANPFVYGITEALIPYRYSFGNIGYLSVLAGNNLVIRNDGVLANYAVTVSGYIMNAAGTLSRF